MKSALSIISRSSIVIAALISLSQNVEARSADPSYIQPHYERQSSIQIGQMVVGSQSLSFSADTYNANNPYAYFANMGGLLIKNLDSSFDALVAKEVTQVQYYQNHNSNVYGELNIKIDHAKTTIQGLHVDLEANFRKSKKFLFISVSAQCNVKIGTNSNFVISGNLNPNAGILSNIQINNLSFYDKENCSSSADWIPVIGKLIKGYMNKKVKSLIQGQIQKLPSSLQGALKSQNFLGLDKAFKSGKYVFSGVDYGSLINKELSNLIYNSITIVSFPQNQFSQPLIKEVNESKLKYTHQTKAVLSFPLEKISFSVFEDNVYKFVSGQRGYDE